MLESIGARKGPTLAGRVTKLDFDLGREHEPVERLTNTPLIAAERARNFGRGHGVVASREQLANPNGVAAGDVGER